VVEAQQKLVFRGLITAGKNAHFQNAERFKRYSWQLLCCVDTHTVKQKNGRKSQRKVTGIAKLLPAAGR
jgi:hypothetical protein